MNIKRCPLCGKSVVSVGPEAVRCTGCGKFITLGGFAGK